MEKFKTGDKVVFIGTTPNLKDLVGKEGTVISKTVTSRYEVDFEGYEGGHEGTSGKQIKSRLYCDTEPNLPFSIKLADRNTHYETAVQPIEFMQANMAPEEFVGFLKGNIIKYAGRCGRKDEPLKEAKKIKQYAGWLVEALEGKTINPRG